MCWFVISNISKRCVCLPPNSVFIEMGSGWKRAFGNTKEAAATTPLHTTVAHFHDKTENHVTTTKLKCKTSKSPTTISASNPSSPRLPFSIFKNTLRLPRVSSNYKFLILSLLPQALIFLHLIICRVVVGCVCRT